MSGRTAKAARRSEATRTAETDAALEAIWARIPDAGCEGLCADSCGPIGMSEAERARIRRRHGLLIRDAETKPGTLECPALADGRCSVYEDRPILCRSWASVEAMPRPHGCEPAGGRLPDAAVVALFTAARDLDGTRRPDGQLLQAVHADPAASRLLARAMRGDRSAYPALAAAIRAVQNDT